MKAHICTTGNDIPEPDGGWPAPPTEPCCAGMAIADPGQEWAECECWIPVFNHETGQVQPDPETARILRAGIEPAVRPSGMCGDCAYRPDSPEKRGEPNYKGDADFLEEIAANGERFWCHDGMMLVIAWRHPSGLEVPGRPAAYIPPQQEGVPYQHDGQPGYVCAGWDARRRALAARSREAS